MDMFSSNSSTSFNHRGCDNTTGERFKRYITRDGDLIGISCAVCYSEWVTDNFVSREHRGPEMLEIDGERWHLINKPDEGRKSTFPTQWTSIRDLDNLAQIITAGDHISYQLSVLTPGLSHHAIVKSVKRRASGPDKVTLVHWQFGQGSRMEEAPPSLVSILEETVDDIKKNASVIYRCDYSDDTVSEDSRVLTLARANAWIGETGYKLTQKNCEHFAVFCKTGQHRSFQGEVATDVVSEVVRCMINYTDESVEDISRLSIGDQVVMYMSLIHPRCHMIVAGVDADTGTINVIRFTFARGVVEEKLKFRKPVYKVVSDSPFSSSEVISRAREPVREVYNIFGFNCKHFAFRCRTGQIPSTP